MLQSAMPTKGKRVKPPVITSEVIARRAAGQPIAKIARELGMSPNTAKSIIRESQIDSVALKESVSALVKDSIKTVHSTVNAGDADLGMRVLENTIFKDQSNQGVHIDARVQTVIGELLAPPAPRVPLPAAVGDIQDVTPIGPLVTSDTHVTPGDTSTDQGSTEAAAKPGEGQL